LSPLGSVVEVTEAQLDAFTALSGAGPAQLRAAVCSPGGATIAGIHELENRALRAAVMSAVVAARDRSAEMGR
jgi:pyrroline-5-carboxylate reductase